jgi:hypothetical protein
MPDHESELMQAVKAGLQLAVRDRLANQYNSPLEKVLVGIVEAEKEGLRELLFGSIRSALADPSFREQIAGAVRHKLAKVLVERFGGELEKQVNLLKSDPATRARITLAIEEIVRAKTQGG